MKLCACAERWIEPERFLEVHRGLGQLAHLKIASAERRLVRGVRWLGADEHLR